LGDLKGALELWVVLLITSAAASLVAAFSELEWPLIDAVVSCLVAAIVLFWCWGDRSRIRPLLAEPGFRGNNWWITPLVLLGFGLFMTAYMSLLELTRVGVESYVTPFRDAGWPMWTAFLLISVHPAIFEEFAFRGVIQERLGLVMQPRDTLIVQAAMFSVLHMLPLIFVSHFVLGLALGWLRLRTGSLLPCMLVHGLWNAWVLMGELTGGA